MNQDKFEDQTLSTDSSMIDDEQPIQNPKIVDETINRLPTSSLPPSATLNSVPKFKGVEKRVNVKSFVDSSISQHTSTNNIPIYNNNPDLHHVLDFNPAENRILYPLKETVQGIATSVQAINTDVVSFNLDVDSILNDYAKALSNIDLAMDEQTRLLSSLTETEIMLKEVVNTDDRKKIMDMFQLVKSKPMLGKESILSFLERLYYFRAIQKNELDDKTAVQFKDASKELLKITTDIDGLIGKLSKVEIIQNVLPSLQKLYGGIEQRIEGKLSHLEQLVSVDIDTSITSICGQVDLILSNQYTVKYLLAQKNTLDYLLLLQKNKAQ